MSLPPFRSTIPGLRWPGLPGQRGAEMLAMQYQFARSERWPPEVLQAQQFHQIESLVAYCDRANPFWRDRLRKAGIRRGQALTPALYSRLPPLARAELQAAGDAVNCRELPEGHGKATPRATSGSTGIPVTVLKSELMLFMVSAFHVRNALWHGAAVTEKYAIIRIASRIAGLHTPVAADGWKFPDWGEEFTTLFPHTGPTVRLDIRAPLARQAEWLIEEQPTYLLTNPSNADRLARHFRHHGLRLGSLRAIHTLAETLSEDTRNVCREVFGVEIVDVYSGEEPGVIALQCPEHGSYHVMSESVYVEVLDAENRHCQPGQIGNVVVTPLHNFATPLLRYHQGDLAEVGEPCRCGRGLPVLKRILGRARDIVRLPNGDTRYAYIANSRVADVPAVMQFRIAQVALDRLEFRAVVHRELTQAERDTIAGNIRAALDHPFQIDFVYVDELPRTEGGKYHEFISELATA